jgi:hypothetical protein
MLSRLSSISFASLNNVFHMSGFLGQDTGDMKLDEVTQMYAVLSHCWFLSMWRWWVLFDPGLNGTPCFSNRDLLIFAGCCWLRHADDTFVIWPQKLNDFLTTLTAYIPTPKSLWRLGASATLPSWAFSYTKDPMSPWYHYIRGCIKKFPDWVDN